MLQYSSLKNGVQNYNIKTRLSSVLFIFLQKKLKTLQILEVKRIQIDYFPVFRDEINELLDVAIGITVTLGLVHDDRVNFSAQTTESS